MAPIIVLFSSVSSTLRKIKADSNDVLPTPHSVDEIIQHLPPISELLPSTALNGEQAIHAIPSLCIQAGQSIALFTESSLLEISSKSKMAFIDGTFKYFPSIFHQLLIVHFEVKAHVCHKFNFFGCMHIKHIQSVKIFNTQREKFLLYREKISIFSFLTVFYRQNQTRSLQIKQLFHALPISV
jgi:hypothetical protein